MKQLIVAGPNDYEGCSRQLGSELGCWQCVEFSPGIHSFQCAGPQTLCVMKGSGVVGGQSVGPGTVIDALDRQILNFSVNETIMLRHCYLSSIELRERLDALKRRCISTEYWVQGRWAPCDIEALSAAAESQIYFCAEPGAMRDRLFSTDGASQTLLDLSISGLQIYTFQGLSPESEIAGKARLVVGLGEQIPDLRSEELFCRRRGAWHRWVSDPGGEPFLEDKTRTFGHHSDRRVEAVLSTIWKRPSSLCKWMHTVPIKSDYAVPYLVIPGRSISEALKTKWEIRAVCSYSRPPIQLPDLVVTITDSEVEWRVNGAREMATWSYSFNHATGEVSCELTEVYD